MTYILNFTKNEPTAMKKPTKTNKGQVQVSISMKVDQLKAIDAAARVENRSRSNWIMNLVSVRLNGGQ